MHKHFKNAYLAHRPVQFASWLVLLSLCVLLIYGAGGLPPTSWRMLFQVTPLLPHLWLMQKTGLLLPLFLLVSQALTWLILACLLLRAGMTLLYYAWSAKQQYQSIIPTFPDWQRQQAPMVVNPSSYPNEDLHNASTDAIPLSELSSFASVSTSGRHAAIHIPSQSANRAVYSTAPPFPPMPVPIPASGVSVPRFPEKTSSPTPEQRSRQSPFWTFDSIARPD